MTNYRMLPAVMGLALAGIAGFWAGGARSAGDAAAECRAIAGEPDAGAPVSREALTTHFRTLGKARAHCEVAVIGAQPDPAALFHLAVIMQREGAHEHALEVFSMAAGAGIAAAHTKLGDYYNFGIGPVREDHERAVSEYRKAADGGDAPAKSTLAIMHQIGRGVPQDFDRMIELLQESAEAGYHFAQFRLAEIYMNPRSVPGGLARRLDLPDPVGAAELYKKAADQGSADASAALARFYEDGAEFEDPETKLKWIRHAAEEGDARAINALGFMYERGDGVEYDPMRAAELYIEALETGELPVAELRGGSDGNRVPWDVQTALEFQTILQARGFYNGALDAQVGPGTLSAARRLAGG
ncbi:tetratricopeptide repeat protein [Roseovarius salis]|uniref:tetratricopeptide repeat protein n=1 Tax=Roseovarius salis TaxID=3376063 RepID=UPI0037C7C41E